MSGTKEPVKQPWKEEDKGSIAYAMFAKEKYKQTKDPIWLKVFNGLVGFGEKLADGIGDAYDKKKAKKAAKAATGARWWDPTGNHDGTRSYNEGKNFITGKSK